MPLGPRTNIVSLVLVVCLLREKEKEGGRKGGGNLLGKFYLTLYIHVYLHANCISEFDLLQVFSELYCFTLHVCISHTCTYVHTCTCIYAKMAHGLQSRVKKSKPACHVTLLLYVYNTCIYM